MKTNTVFLGLMCVCFLAAAASAISIENLISLLRPDYFRLDGWLALDLSVSSLTTSITTITTSTTTTTMPYFIFGNESITYNASWCLNITQLTVDDYAFLYEGRKINLNASTVGAIMQADLLNCTRIIRVRADTSYIKICNNSNSQDVWGVNCKYAAGKCIATQDSCGGNSGRWNCEYSY